MAMIRKTVKVGDRDLIIETGRMAKQADGAVVVRYGDTMLLATSVSAKDKKDVDFLPLTVEYKENFAAAGRIPGGYFRREGRLTEKETLTSRIVDRSCRPSRLQPPALRVPHPARRLVVARARWRASVSCRPCLPIRVSQATS